MISGLKNTTSSWFEAYAALSTCIMILQTATDQLLPLRLRSFIFSIFKRFFGFDDQYDTLTIENNWESCSNELYEAAKQHLSSKMTDANKNLRVGVGWVDDEIAVAVQEGEAVEDVFDNTKITWRFCIEEDPFRPYDNKRMYVLSYSENDREKVLGSYLPQVLSTYMAIEKEKMEMVIHTWDQNDRSCEPSPLDHPSTFDTLTIEPELKKGIVDDLDRSLMSEDFYKKVGKRWKCGYLLYGPPGTGKSSLIATIANYAKYDVYNLELTAFSSDDELMIVLLDSPRCSLIVVKDIDCNKAVHD